MKPAAFRYVAARSIDEAVATLAAEGGDAKLLAGGQSLMPMLNFRLVRPSVLVDLNRIPGASGMSENDGALTIRALTRHAELEMSPLVARRLPVIAEAMRHVAHLAIRNRGTFGGSLSHADPAAELPMLARLLDATIHTASPRGPAAHGAARFFVSALTTSLAPDEIVTHVTVPLLSEGTGWGFEEFARRHGDYALAAVAVTLRSEMGRAADVRIAMMGVGDTPLRADAAERGLAGQTPDADSITAAVDAVRAAVEPNTDLHASSDFRRHLVGVLAQRAIQAAWRRAAHG